MNANPELVVFGAGSVGRGFLGDLFSAAGYRLVFIDTRPDLVDALNRRGEYTLRLAGPDRVEARAIVGVRALLASEHDGIAEALASARLAATAVGGANLPQLIQPLLNGATLRNSPLDVLLCENQSACAAILRRQLELADPFVSRRIGLVDCVVSRMAPLAAVRGGDILEVTAEDYPTLPVATTGFLGEPPAVPGVVPVGDIAPLVEEKLYLHNMAHAATAYLGALEGAVEIEEALTVPSVRATVAAALDEVCLALSRRRNEMPDRLREHAAGLMRRFANPRLHDTVARVARDPLRKLRPGDRLLGALQICLDEGVDPPGVARSIAAALHYSDPQGADAEPGHTYRTMGPATALSLWMCLSPEGEAGRWILRASEELDGPLHA